LFLGTGACCHWFQLADSRWNALTPFKFPTPVFKMLTTRLKFADIPIGTAEAGLQHPQRQGRESRARQEDWQAAVSRIFPAQPQMAVFQDLV
jgi:hypothetical protein